MSDTITIRLRPHELDSLDALRASPVHGHMSRTECIRLLILQAAAKNKHRSGPKPHEWMHEFRNGRPPQQKNSGAGRC